ncbi:hypothetical protein NWT39_00545 [Nitrososphaera viennensis]|uniref:Uncharacterized protein n=3 Tax=Nitrososphaera viennensis TaxID=1034015 RepID=A0A060HFB7_9ARCH|nr:hypothetical protein [Nitrososphaera viennensis]AIC14298.1 hypothetical protein NVIE_001160 [Nitrososphaera viennensis EN76]UVS69292.1 hypothetical protein NWT39_00545 [Nitrososphaera viennensis]
MNRDSIMTAAFVVLVLLTATSQVAYALPSPIQFQRSIPFSVFNTTSATVYTADKPISPPFEIDIVNQLTYNSTGTKAAGVKFQDATTGSMNALEIKTYNNKAIDILWTDKTTGSTTKIGGMAGEEQQSFPKEIIIENQGSSLSIKLADGTVIIDSFVLPSNFKILAVSAFGNEASVASDGFITVYVGGLSPTKMVSVSVNVMVPLLTAIVTIGIVFTLFSKLKNKI